ncbi:uncharacterized protein LOC109862867 [Pseudomyrmex gracilis]|uniref:uncharacterized protein LOC109862867 n=1 Tax=Pseudomyrmex gracilis TaxID=219809 RepID=UPI000994A0B9|nr:uncharacterized protein LOC109862867 [Pseudomyrmex gracilis]
MEDFEKADNRSYKEVVDYLKYVGGFTIKEAVNLSFKEAIKDSVMAIYTWFGREESKPLCNTKIVTPIYKAVCFNRNFGKPSRAEFQTYMREALRSSKQRH